ncbi:hypothetical protein DRO42_07420 [Candidatus Bathyarchaeota archaeon]|nr:MAG: hypothetical protein DRO42_07420 [Candidatus Bathyarchaeota archaeon]
MDYQKDNYRKVRAKFYSNSVEALVSVLAKLRRTFPTNADFSRVLPSQQGGGHAYICVYVKDEEES